MTGKFSEMTLITLLKIKKTMTSEIHQPCRMLIQALMTLGTIRVKRAIDMELKEYINIYQETI